MTYILVDTANMFFRARHAVKGDSDLKLGMALHIMFHSVRKAWQDFDGKHVVFCLEGRSWRKDFYEPYKRNRQEARAALTPAEQEEDNLFFEAFADFKNFIIEKTNCTVLSHSSLEGDDLIAGFIQLHPNANHVIISTDSDFQQLINTNVKQYNGISDVLITHEGYYDAKGNQLKDNKTGEFKKPLDPEWMLFEKCMRGDTSDNIFSAYPGVRTKSTKKKVGLIEAFQDKDTKGYNWNNLMLQEWVDHNEVTHKVMDDYQRNKMLIDLRCQPEHIRTLIEETIAINSVPKDVAQVGINMLKFCKSYDMKRMMDNIQSFAIPFQSRYIGE